MQAGQTPVFVMSKQLLANLPLPRHDIDICMLDTTPERQSGRKAQISNITAAKVGCPTYGDHFLG